MASLLASSRVKKCQNGSKFGASKRTQASICRRREASMGHRRRLRLGRRQLVARRSALEGTYGGTARAPTRTSGYDSVSETPLVLEVVSLRGSWRHVRRSFLYNRRTGSLTKSG